MEAKELKITIPEGFEIDKENSSFEKIVFKKKENTKPKSWEEYCKLQKENFKYGYMIDDTDAHIDKVEWKHLNAQLNTQNISGWRNVLPSKELAEAFLAMMQLMSLRQEWIGDWEPYWNNRHLNKYSIIGKFNSEFEILALNAIRCPLSFPTREMAEDFMNTFKDLLKVAKPLI